MLVVVDLEGFLYHSDWLNREKQIDTRQCMDILSPDQ